MVGTGGGGTERRVCVLGLSEIGSGARASHLLHWVVVYRFDFPLLVWSLVLRTLLYLAVVLPLLCHARLDRVSGLCLRYLGWYLRNAIVLGAWGGTEIDCSF